MYEILENESIFTILLMEEILHQLIGSLSHHLQGLIHPRWCRISSINSIIHTFFATHNTCIHIYITYFYTYTHSTNNWYAACISCVSKIMESNKIPMGFLLQSGFAVTANLESHILPNQKDLSYPPCMESDSHSSKVISTVTTLPMAAVEATAPIPKKK